MDSQLRMNARWKPTGKVQKPAKWRNSKQLFRLFWRIDSGLCGPGLALSSLALVMMKRSNDFFEGLAEFDEDIPEAKRYKMAEDESGGSVEHGQTGMNGEDSGSRPQRASI